YWRRSRPASGRAAGRSRGRARPHGGGLRSGPSAVLRSPSQCPASVCEFSQFDLLGADRLDPRSVALLDPPAHPDTAILQLFRLQPRPREHALMSFRYGDRERLRPTSAEVHVYHAPTFADRQNLAFDDREMALFRD